MKAYRLLLCIGMLLLCTVHTQAQQLSLTIMMDPNPSPYISDWRSNPNTIRFLVNNPTGNDVPVRFVGYIEGNKRGRVAETNPDASIPPVMIPPGSSSYNAVDVYLIEEGVVMYRGESRAETKRTGRLPEDDFRLCVQLMAHEVPHDVMSPLACTSFSVRLLEAPALIAPANRSVVTANPAFQWTTVPMGRAVFAKYRLTLIELDPGQENVANAMRTNIPLMVREGRSVPVYQFMASDPPLEKGHRYAWQVEAYDEAERYMFKDNGRSEIWSFTFDPPVPPGFKQTVTLKDKKRSSVSSNINVNPNMVFAGMTRFRGMLKATWYKSRIPKARSVEISGSSKPVKPSSSQSQPPPTQQQQTVQAQQGGGTLQQAATVSNTFTLKQDEAMGGIHLKLYRRCRTVPECGYYPFMSGGKTYVENTLVATTTTKPDGSFEFTFFCHDSTGRILTNADISCGAKEFVGTVKGDLYQYYQIEVGDLHLCSPSDEFKVQPGESFDAGTLFSLVRSYTATFEVHHVWGEDDYVLSGMNVAVVRGSRPFDVPSNEGPLDPHEPTIFNKMGLGNSEIIGRGETSMQGLCSMNFFAKNMGAGDTYHVSASSSEESERYYHTTMRTFDFSFLLDERDDAGQYLKYDFVTFNEEYNPQDMQAVVRVNVTPKKPRISGTLHRSDNPGMPLTNTNVLLYRKQVIPLFVGSCTTNDTGGFVFDNLIPTQNTTYYYIVVDKVGYKYHREPPVGEIKVPMGVKKFFPILLEPKLEVKGRLIDEFGRPVAGKVRIGNGSQVHTVKKYYAVPQTVQTVSPASNPVVQQSLSAMSSGARKLQRKTKPRPFLITYDEEFTTPAVPGIRKMYIQPDNLEDYLSDELVVLLPNSAEDIGDFTVYRRAHRLAVRAVTQKVSSGGSNPKGGQLSYSATMSANQFSLKPVTYETVPGARITVNGMEADSVDAAGVSYFVWVASGMQADIVVEGPEGSDFVRKEVSVPVPDDEPVWLELDVPIALGGRLEGIVTVGSVPIADARVLLYDNPGDTEPLTAVTGSDGHFVLHAIPAGNHTFLAAKSKSPYIGDTARAYIPRGGSATRDFSLKAYNDMDITRLLGFPIEVTALDSTGGKILLSGNFVELPDNDHFRLEEATATLAFTNVVVVASSETNSQGLPLAKPETLPLATEADELALVAFEHFGASQYDPVEGIHLGQDGSVGEVRGRVSVNPAYFQFGSGSLDFGMTHIGLARDLASPDRLLIPALTSDGSRGHQDVRGYYAGMEDGTKLQFTFYEFAADVDSSSCFFNMDTLSLPTVLHTNISTIVTPDLAVDIGSIRAHHDGVDDIVSGNEIIIPLGGDWTMNGRSWTLDQNGFRLDSGHVDAQLVQVPFTGLQIFPDQIEYGNYALNHMTVSNTVEINFTGDPYFVYDVGTNDWKVGAAPASGETTCGFIDALPGMAPGDKILIESFYVKSNGAKNFKPYSGNNITLYNVATYAINQMYAKSDYIEVGGNLDLGIPGLAQINLTSNYGKEEGVVVFHPDPLTETISVNGVKIKFKTSGGDPPQWFDSNGYHANVDVYEEGAFRLASMLHRTPSKTEIIVNTGEEVPIGTVKMTDVVGDMKVDEGAWTLFWFEGDLINNNQGGRLKFTVQGDIVASDQEIGVDQISTPFGDISLVYNFDEQQLEGTLHVEQDLSGTIIVGDATLIISGAGKGWYFFCGASFSLPSPKVDGTAAFAVGDFLLTQEQLDQFASYSYNNQGLPQQFHDFNGFFFEGTVKFPPPAFCPNFDFDFGLVSAHLTCQIGANARFGMNFGPVDTYFIAIRAIGNLEAGVGASIGIACAGLTAGILIDPSIEGMYQSDGTWYVLGDFPITLYGSTYAGWGMCDSDCEGSLCDKESLTASITLGLQGYVGSDDKYFKFYFK